MKTASIQEIKQELNNLSSKELVELCLRLARFKKENKELLTYLLFESNDINAYIERVKVVMKEQFEAINTQNIFFIKKSLRKIARLISKYSKYSANPIVDIELLIAYCTQIKAMNLALTKYPVLHNLYQAQLKKIDKALSSLHEDLQFDYSKQRMEL